MQRPFSNFFPFLLLLLPAFTQSLSAQAPKQSKKCHLPAPVITGPDSVCRGIPVSFSAPGVAGTTVRWSMGGALDSAFIYAPLADTTSVSFLNFPATLQAVCVATDGSGCTSRPVTKTIHRLSPYMTITGNDKPCHSTRARYRTGYTDGDYYDWRLANPMAGSILNNGGQEVEVIWNAVAETQPTMLYVRVFKCGWYYSQKLEIAVQGPPRINAVLADNTEILPDQPVTMKVALSEPLAAGSRFVWQWGDGPAQTQTILPNYHEGYYHFTHTYSGLTPAVDEELLQVTPLLTIRDANGCRGDISADAPTLTLLPPDKNSVSAVRPKKPVLQYELSCNPHGRNYQVTLYGQGDKGVQELNYYGPQGILLAENAASVPTFQSPGETQTYLLVQAGNSPDTARVTVTTPRLPVVQLTPAEGPELGCEQQTAFLFRRLEEGNPNWRYSWHFGDGAYYNSNEMETGRVYDFPGSIYTILTVTDAYGCTDTAMRYLEVRPNGQKSTGVNTDRHIACAGEEVTLTYMPLGASGYPDSVTWYRGHDPIAVTEGITPLNITLPCGYWVRGKDRYGCTSLTNMVAPAFRKLPPVSISGSKKQTVGRTFTLSAPDYGPGYTYTWDNGQETGGGARLTQTLQQAGAYTYTVTLTDTTTNCSRSSAPFQIIVKKKNR